jgi:hypothetical protein
MALILNLTDFREPTATDTTTDGQHQIVIIVRSQPRLVIEQAPPTSWPSGQRPPKRRPLPGKMPSGSDRRSSCTLAGADDGGRSVK